MDQYQTLSVVCKLITKHGLNYELIDAWMQSRNYHVLEFVASTLLSFEWEFDYWRLEDQK